MNDKLTTIIVDDEINARENLRYLTQTFCPDIEIIYEASNVNDGIYAIEKYKPNLVFLDIEMPQKNGFQLLNHFKKIEFKIIFVTAYDRYAIKAFKVSALDYLLKPIDIQQLKDAVKKVSKAVEQVKFRKRIDLLHENQKRLKKIAVPYKSDYVIIDLNDIMAIRADRMYSTIYVSNGKTYTASKKLNHFETIFSNVDFMFRIHRSWIVNSNHIHLYSKKDKNITLKNELLIPISKTYKEQFETLF